MKRTNKKSSSILPIEHIQERIIIVRERKVMIDRDLAELYGVPTRRLNEQVRRNRLRFPDDFVFILNQEEKNEVIANCDHLEPLKYSKSLPLAFTEHGAIMAANILNSDQAIRASVFVVRAFVKLREMAFTTKSIQIKLDELEKRINHHDHQLYVILSAIKQIISPPEKSLTKISRIGFKTDDEKT